VIVFSKVQIETFTHTEAGREPGPSVNYSPFTPSNNPELGPVVVVRDYAFFSSDCLELCASYCGWKILLQSIEHLGRQRA
jgi:hypothetical protein